LAIEPLEDRFLLTMIPTLTALGGSASQVMAGQPVTWVADVRASSEAVPVPTGGTVTFNDGSVTLGTVPVVAGRATLVNSLFDVGSRTITATYNGDGVYASSMSAGAGLPIQVADYSPTGASGFSVPMHVSNGGASVDDGQISPMSTIAPTGMTPTEIRQAYGTSNLSFGTQAADGTGTTIAIVDAYDDPNIATDLAAFDGQFSLAAPPSFIKCSQTGSTTNLPVANSGWITEIALDVEWAHAVAPGAGILLVEANSNSNSDLYTAVDYARRVTGVVAVSMSWGGGESSSELSTDSYFTTPSGHSGVTFLASSGDNGAPAIYPSISPNVVSVGGTSLYLTAQGTYSTESGWSGSGGGISSYEPQPAYQAGVVTQSTTYRTDPDVSYDADPNTGFPVYDSYNNGTVTPWGQWGGTSDAAPQWAALVAIADQGRALAGKSALDGPSQTLPLLYQALGAHFHDITTGTSFGSPNYSCGSGYDLVTGRGTPHVDLIVGDLENVTFTSTALSVSAGTVTYGQPVTLTATVSVVAPGTGTPTGGTVTFLDYGTAIGTATLTGGTATFTSSTLGYGIHQLASSYAGNPGLYWPSSTPAYGLTALSIISTAAGAGVADGVPATATILSNPQGVATDSAGDLFIADTSDNRVREVNHSTGVITTVAGTGIAGYSGDGSQATAAMLSGPDGVAVDSSGNLYIADTNNNRIRKVVLSTGVITTVAGTGLSGSSGDGGQATAATVYSPHGVAVDGSGDLFIADYYNNRIRKVVLSTGIISTVAGNGSTGSSGDGGQATAAFLDDPTGVAVDASGNLFIADYFNNRIREVVLSTGIISTVAGNGTYGFSGDGGQATAAYLEDPSGVAVDASGNLYIADKYNNRVREVYASNSTIATIAGSASYGYSGDGAAATAAKLYYPTGVALDSSGNLYIADSSNSRVREVSLGTISTFAGGFLGDGGAATAATLNAPFGSAMDAAGDIFIADTANNRVREINHATGIITTVAGTGTYGYSGDGSQATAAMLYSPRGVAVDSAGNLYIADTTNQRIRKVVLASGIITTVAGNGMGGYTGDGSQATAAELYSPYSVALDGNGHLFIADYSNQRIREVTLSTGVITTVAGGSVCDGQPATAAPVNYPYGVAVDSAGNVYIADTNDNRVRELNRATGLISTVAGTGVAGFSGDGSQATAARLNSPWGVAFDSSGNLYIADSNNERIRKVVLSTGVITTIAGNGSIGYNGDGIQATAAELYYPRAVAFDSSGNLFIADCDNQRIRKVILSTGVISTIAGNGSAGYNGDGIQSTAAALDYPCAVAVDGSGNLYIADTDNNRIRKVVLSTGLISTVAGNGTFGFSGDGGAATAAELEYPYGIAVDASGNLYIADSSNNRVREVLAATGVISTVAGGSYGFAGDGGPATASRLYNPRGVALDSSGNLYIADTSNYRIREIVQASGIINTIAGNGFSSYGGDGGQATAAALNYPQGVTVDSLGNLYIADSNNNRVRRINLSSGVITTVAGAGSSGYSGDSGAATAAMLNSPRGVAVDAAGDLLIADYYNNRVREVVASTGTIGTLAGSTSGFGGDGGAAGSALLAGPTEVMVDASGNVYVVDSGNNRLREVAFSGVTLTVNPAALSSTSLTLTPPSNATYGGTATLSATLSCGGVAVAGELIAFSLHGTNVAAGVTNAAGVATISGVSVAGYVPGTYAAYLGAVFAGNVSFQTSNASSTLTVVPAPLTVTANNASKVYGTSDPAFSASYAGFVAGEGLGNLGGTLVFSTNEPGSGYTPAGTYTIIPSGLTSTNYAITFVGGTLTVNPAATTTAFAVSTQSSVYGQSLTFTATVTVSAPSVATPTGGTVAFWDGATEVGTAALTRGQSVFTTTALGAGSHTLWASYLGDGGNFSGSGGSISNAIITTASGNGTGGFSGDGGPATAAELDLPYGVAVDASGNLFIADAGNNRIREVNASTGAISTVAGNGTGGFSGDGGAATAAEIDEPFGVAVDANGNLFIADAENNRIREVNLSTGTIATVAGGGSTLGDGGPATLAMLSTPYAVAVDGAGHLFIGDAGNNRIREVALATGTITTVAGNGTGGFSGDGGQATAAEINFPEGIALDTGGDLFIADEGNARVREVNASTGVITTVAGTGTEGYSGDGGPATAAMISYPRSVAVDAMGDLFISDTNNDRIRVVNPFSGVITTAVGNGTAGFAGDGGPASAAEINYPRGIAVDASGRLFIADMDNNRIRVLTLPMAPISVSVAPAPLTIAADNLTKFYGAALPTLTASYTGLVNGDTPGSLSTAPTLTTTATAASPVGSYGIAIGGAVEPNYTISYAGGTLTVAPEPLVIAAAAGSKVYGTADPAFSVSYFGLIPGDTPASLDGTLAFQTNEPAGGNAPAGTYAVTPTGLTSPNYAIAFASGPLVVSPAPLIVMANGAVKSYGSADPAFSVTAAGFAPGDSVAHLGGTLAFQTNEPATGNAPAGSYQIVPAGWTSANYTITYANGTLTVLPAPLTITAVSQSSVYGAALPALTAAYSGFVGGDSAASLTTPPAITTTATPADPVGGYPISVASAVDPNYSISYSAGTLTITRAPLTVTAGDQSKTYGQTASLGTTAFIITGGSLINGDTLTGVTLASGGAAATATVSGSPYPIVSGDAQGTGLSNYTITYANGQLTVNPATPTVTATDAGGTYNAQPYAATTTVTGVSGPASGSLEGVSPTFTYHAGSDITGTSLGGTAPTNTGTYTVVASFAGSADYTSADSLPATFTISAKAASVTPDPALKTFGGTDASFTGTLSGFIASDGVTASYSRTVGETVGTYTIGATLNPTAILSDYDITYNTAVFTINPATPTVTATDAGGTYNAQPYAATTTVTGVSGPASGSLEGISPTFTYYVGSDTNGQNLGSTAPTNAGTYTVVASFAGSTDYTSAQSLSATFTISAKAASVTPDAAQKTFGDGDVSFTGTLSGFVASDGVTASYSRTAGETVGTYTINAALGPAAILANYAITYNTAEFTIGPATPMVVAFDAGGTYNAQSFAATATVTGVSGLASSSLEGVSPTFLYYPGNTATGDGSATPPSAAGTYTVVATFAGSADYTSAQSLPATFTIAQAPLTVTASDQSKTYGQAASLGTSAFAITTGVLYGEDTLTGVTLSSDGATATAAVADSPYAIVPSDAQGAGLNNYTIGYQDGSLTVNPASLTITAKDATKTFGQSLTFTGTEFTTAGLLNSDTVDTVTLSSDGAAATATVSGSPYSTVPGEATGTGLGNYLITYTNGQLTVSPATPTVTATDADATYNAEPYAATATVAGVVAGVDTTPSPTLEGVSLAFTYYIGNDTSGQSLGNTAPINAGTYTVVASFAGSTDYTSADSVPATFTISTKAASVTPDAAQKTFGGADPALTGMLSGIIAGDGVTANYSRTAGETAGTYTISAVLSPAAVLANYAITYNTAEFTINQTTPMVTIADSGGTYNGSAFPATATATGVSGQPAASLENIPLTVTYYAGGTASGTGSTTAPSDPGTYTAIASFSGSTDYTAAQSPPVTFAILSNAPAPIGTEMLGSSQPGFWCSGSGTWSSIGQGLDGSTLISSTANGSQQSQAAWWFSMPAGVYEIDMTWPAAANLTTKLGLDLYDGVGNWIGQIPVNEQVAPSDFSDQGVEWKRLGCVDLTNNIFHISTWNSATDGAIAIGAIRLRAVATVNDGDVQLKGRAGSLFGSYFTTAGSWTPSSQGAFGGSETSTGTAGSGRSIATWNMPVAPGAYEVDATWAADASLSANVTYNVYDGSTLLGSVNVNQQAAPSGVTDGGIAWQSLGDFTVSGNQLTVTVANAAADGQVCADAIRILPASQPTEIIANTYPGSWLSATGWTASSQGLFGQALVSNTANGSKASQAAWWFAVQPGQYEVDVTWQADPSYSQNVGFDVYNGLKWIETAAVNEQNAPVGVTDQGVVWQSLGVFTMTSDMLHVSLWNSQSDGAICIDGVRIVPVGTSAANDETSASAAMAVAAPVAAASPLAVPPAASTPLASGGSYVDAALAATGQFTLTAGVALSASSRNANVALSATALPTLESKLVDQIDLPSIADSQAGLLGLDLNASLDLLMSDQLGVGVRCQL
jgi:uncharacterized protein YjiK